VLRLPLPLEAEASCTAGSSGHRVLRLSPTDSELLKPKKKVEVRDKHNRGRKLQPNNVYENRSRLIRLTMQSLGE